MWFCKKKKIEEVQNKPKKKIVYKEQEFNIGRTGILLELMDGTKLTIAEIGRFDQYVDDGEHIFSIVEPKVGPYIITPSQEAAMNRLPTLTGEQQHGFSDYKAPDTRYYSPLKSATITWTEDFNVICTVAEIVEE